MTMMQKAECKWNTMQRCHWPQSMTRMHAFVSLTAVNDTDACIRVIDRWSMTRMHWVWFTLGNLHSCHWPNCICVIDRSIRGCKKTWFRHWCHWPMVNDTNALSVIYTQQSASVSLTKLHSCHWPLYKGVQKSPFRLFCHWPLFHDLNALSVIYTQQSASCHWPPLRVQKKASDVVIFWFTKLPSHHLSSYGKVFLIFQSYHLAFKGEEICLSV